MADETIYEIEDIGFSYSPYPHKLSGDPSISMWAKALFAVYGHFTNRRNPVAFPSEKTLCRMCGCNNKTLHKYKKELIKSGWISQEQSRNEKGFYGVLRIKRYENPLLNPHYKPHSSDNQKTECGKTECSKMVGQEQQQKENNNQKNHTHRVSSCVEEKAVGKKASESLTSEQKEAIELISASRKKKRSDTK